MINEIYQYAIDQASIVSVTDIKGVITYVNKNFCAISGYSREELLGDDHRLLSSGYHSKEFFRVMWKHLLSGNIWKGEICNKTKDGTLYWVKSTISPIFNKHGEVSEFISIREDITSKKRINDLFNQKNKILDFILDSQKSVFFQYTLKENRLKYDENFLNLFGLKRGEFGDSLEAFLSLFSENERGNLNHKFRNTNLLEDETFEYRITIKRPNNDLRIIRIFGKLLTSNGPEQPEVLFGLVTDLTEKNKLESLLSRTQEVARIGAWELDLTNNSFILSPMTYRIYGYAPYSFEPKFELFIKNSIPPEYSIQLREAYQQIQLSEGTIQLDLPAITKENTTIWLRHIINSKKVDEGVFKVFGTTQDINKEKILELSLKQSMKRFDIALETAGFGICEFFYDNKRLVIDDFLKSLMGLDYLEREIIYSDIERCIIDEDFNRIKLEYTTAINKKQTVINTQFRVVKRNEEITYIQSRGTFEYNSKGGMSSSMGLFWDVTKDKEFENILIVTKNKAEESTLMKSEFLASMSHEIRTPMNGVLGMMELLLDTNLDQEQRKLLDTMKTCSDNLLTIVNDVLDLSKIEASPE